MLVALQAGKTRIISYYCFLYLESTEQHLNKSALDFYYKYANKVSPRYICYFKILLTILIIFYIL
ncbi:hypothetical protein AcetOrient_orf04126 [Acetobacter orientalis]|uniref:Uncharacterized protein n=1 Tax=Acetobacter orientalis TaxID=146474 RepID=A0A2Z5ZJP7_9PROT|nr:hypothetical protein AcetOrient_orf04126 [Acetobacter orientalis]